MRKRLKGFIKFASFPLGLFLLLFIGSNIWHSLGLPTFDDAMAYAKAMYQVHGYLVVFISALLEGTLFLNWYLPGSVVILTGAIFAIEGGQSIIITSLLVLIAFFLTTMLNYAMGRYGWYKLLLRFGLKNELDSAKRKLEKYGLIIIILSCVHPHSGSLVAASAGILQMKTKIFILYTFIAFAIWTVIWLTIAYTVGPQFVAMLDFKAVLIMVGFWVFILAFQYIWHIWQNKRLVYAEIVNHRERIFRL